MLRGRGRGAGRLGVLLLAAAAAACTGGSGAADRFNGTWESPGAQLKLWALDAQRLQVEFRGEYEYDAAAGPMVNVGSGAGEASVLDDTATFRPADAEADCAIAMTLSDERLDVTETGACGFGLNVTAAGTYQRIDDDRPDFMPR